MPKYSFDDKQGESSNKAPKSKKIPVEDGNIFFHVGEKGKTLSKQVVAKIKQKAKDTGDHYKMKYPIKRVPKKDKNNEMSKKVKPKNGIKLGNRIWHGLEFIAVTAIIFMVLFFAINYESYSNLFLSKLDQLRGSIGNNPYTQEEIQQRHNASPEGQQPLPIVNSAREAKQQIPELTLSIAPPDDRVIISRINQNVPIIRVPNDMLIKRDWGGLESQIQDALRHGVVHFPGTAMPGDKGNVVLTGHSSYFPWDPGRFKDVFALLHQVSVGDQIIVYHDQTKFVYKVFDKKVVEPDQVDVLTQDGTDRLTLITCTPVGTNLRRLVVLAKPV